MALVKIVYVSTPDRRGPDLDRIGTVEDIDVDAARAMVAGGWATWATDEEVAESQQREEQAPAEDTAQEPAPVETPVVEVPPETVPQPNPAAQ